MGDTLRCKIGKVPWKIYSVPKINVKSRDIYYSKNPEGQALENGKDSKIHHVPYLSVPVSSLLYTFADKNLCID